MSELTTQLQAQIKILRMQRNRALRAMGPMTFVLMDKCTSVQQMTRLIKAKENEPVATEAYRQHIEAAEKELLRMLAADSGPKIVMH